MNKSFLSFINYSKLSQLYFYLTGFLIGMVVGFAIGSDWKVSKPELQLEVSSVQPSNPVDDPEQKEPYVFTEFEPVYDTDELSVAYIKRFYQIAQIEQEKYGQPASVKLAQALLESDRGRSYLSRKANNHFGVKCFSTACKPGHCVNLTDDSHKDFFLVYENAWTSFRKHSLVLQKPRYADCHELSSWQDWCDCLKEKGYATSPTYAKTLKSLIRRFRLYEFDR